VTGVTGRLAATTTVQALACAVSLGAQDAPKPKSPTKKAKATAPMGDAYSAKLPKPTAANVRYGDHERELTGAEAQTTKNRMELMGAIAALEALTRSSRVALYTDSQYVKKGMTEWLQGWKAKGWRTAAKQPVKNVDLWQRLDALVHQSEHRIEWLWVKGHAGDPGNERADALANRGVDQLAR
jgi:ribonuclease HI